MPGGAQDILALQGMQGGAAGGERVGKQALDVFQLLQGDAQGRIGGDRMLDGKRLIRREFAQQVGSQAGMEDEMGLATKAASLKAALSSSRFLTTL